MAHVNRRQWERFAYPAELQLTATGHVLPAKLVDLSERGMQVVVPVKLYAGNTIRAELPTPRAALVVTGRVCWAVADRTDGTAQTRLGVAFDALQPAAEQALRALASERPGTSVSLQLPGSDEPVRASAIRTSQGVRLSFALPFLREGSIVTMQPSDADAEVARVIRTHVYAGGTGTETRIELLVEPCAEARKRRFVHYDEQYTNQPEPAQTIVPSEDAGTLTVPKRRVLANVGYGLSLLAAVWLVSRFGESGSDKSLASPAPGSAIETHASTHSAAPPPSVPARVVAQAKATSTDVKPVTQPTAEPEPARDTTVAIQPEVSAPRSAAPTRSPVVSSTKDTSEIFIPVTGSLAGLETKLWVDPPAVVVEIPRGLVGLSKRRYELHTDGVIGLSVGRPGGVTQLRVYVNSILAQYDTSVVPGGISIRIKRDLQSP